ncbi:MAG: hypothetical protein AVDCRST_MAG40-1348, partial [uncultured Gemmatimonadaceae bacterium]
CVGRRSGARGPRPSHASSTAAEHRTRTHRTRTAPLAALSVARPTGRRQADQRPRSPSSRPPV